MLSLKLSLIRFLHLTAKPMENIDVTGNIDEDWSSYLLALSMISRMIIV